MSRACLNWDAYLYYDKRRVLARLLSSVSFLTKDAAVFDRIENEFCCSARLFFGCKCSGFDNFIFARMIVLLHTKLSWIA